MSLAPGVFQKGPQAPFGRFNEGGSQEGEKTKSSPPECRFLCPFLLDKQKKGGSSRAEKRTSSLVRLRPGAAGQYSSAFLLTRGVKRNRGADQCLHWSAKAPPGLSIHIRICRQRKKAPQALWAGCAPELLGSIRLHSVFPCGGRENRIEVSSSVCTGRCTCPMACATTHSNLPTAQKSTAGPLGCGAFLELLGRFELPTSSLPRMRSTY